MKKSTVSGFVVVLMATSFVAGFFMDRQFHGATEKRTDTPEVARLKADLLAARQETNDFAQETRPKLWLDYDAGNVIRGQFEYDHVWFLRWQNGILDGWVDFDGTDGPQRTQLNFSRRTIDQWAKEGKKPVARGSRGDVLLALRQIGKTDEFDCELYASFMMQEAGGGTGYGVGFRGKHKVTLEPDPRFENAMRFGLFPNKPIFSEPFEISVNRYVNKKAVPWMSVKLIDVPN